MDTLTIGCLLQGNFFAKLPCYPHEQRNKLNIQHAPFRSVPLNKEEKILAIKNILRYIPTRFHKELAVEFLEELKCYGHIYAYRFMPNFDIKAPSIDQIKCRSRQAAAIVLMILNNLDPDIAQFPQELVTYGGNGQVFSNWIQFRLTLRYLGEMDDKQTLILNSGHPQGLFPSHEDAPRVVISNGMMIPNYSTKQLYDKYFALGVTMYGQMTAGSFCYIGPQGIVHGTTVIKYVKITLMNAVQKYLGKGTTPAGKVFVTSGLGGMSGAQAKASVIAGCIGVIAEINEKALKKRHSQGWLDIWSSDLEQIINWIKEYKIKKKAISIGYLGNVVELCLEVPFYLPTLFFHKLCFNSKFFKRKVSFIINLIKLMERLVKEPEGELLVELGSDQTSCHNPFGGGYYPIGLNFEEANELLLKDKPKFIEYVQKSLIRHINAIIKLNKRGMHFWDYGNAFLVECYRAGSKILRDNAKDDKTFIFPSYMQDIMGDIFSLGFGPFRWVCSSGLYDDLKLTDQIAIEIIEKLIKSTNNLLVCEQYINNLEWIKNADKHKLIVGTKARILYSDLYGRIEIANAFNNAVKEGKLKGPIIISRDHHDVGSVDSPFRETSNIEDGSAYTADMSIQNTIGNSFRGATWISIHNGGGVGWGDVINGGFGILLDGSIEAEKHLNQMLYWDVTNGITRRSWAGNLNAKETIKKAMEINNKLKEFDENISK
ncbi:hypothetical protein Mgra_00000544 [Meloidogyne graminicola]|uniref:urocanate hydratase n=1 Tax=Meloidogyne graminicola TaxID=189291 RepID=A0A8T0A3Y0_9BILA|nr:hypothetical protein Mgra_00000544 [Meloidogyne graminicola]